MIQDDQSADRTLPQGAGTGRGPATGPELIGPYRILEKIAEGGFGEVYVAEQTEPVKRRVAVKILKAGMDTKSVLARFEAERQALALMDHPCIAKVWDAGETTRGRPYFVMEYLQGESITEYADRHRLTTSERLELFIPVCEAIQHAHQKAVIHRDIKPSNVLVTEQSDRCVPKIIDFGVAKAMAAPLTEKTLFTEVGQLVGTPAYMSPEQAEMTGMNVDTRTDVYSLGAVLYELLVGAQPFDVDEFRRVGLEGICRILREVDPPRPSTRLSKELSDTAAVSKTRGTTARRLVSELRGDLDWITMKALEKERSRRYPSALDLARDLQRYLRDEPVEAGPPSGGYRLRKFLHRHRSPVAFVASLIVLLAGFGAWMSVMYTRADALREEVEARMQELAVVTDFQASMLGEVDFEGMGTALLGDLRERVAASLNAEGVGASEAEATLASFDRILGRVNATDVALELVDEQVLDRAVVAIDEEFADQPLVRAALQQSIAETYIMVGLYPPAVPLQQSALATRREVLGDDDPKTLESINSMGMLLYEMGRYEEALVYFRAAVEGNRRTLGDDHPRTLSSINNLGGLLFGMGRLDEALVYFREALEGSRRVLGDDDPSTLTKINNMAGLLYRTGELDEALVHFEEVVDRRRRLLGDDHPSTLTSIDNAGMVLIDLGRFDEAFEYVSEALEGRRRMLGDDHPSTLASVHKMGLVLYEMERLEEALGYFREALEGNRRALGDLHPRTVTTMGSLGTVLVDLGRAEEAIGLLGPAENGLRRELAGSGDQRLAQILIPLGRARTGLGEFGVAEARLMEAYELLREPRAGIAVDRNRAMSALVELYDRWHAAEPDGGYDREAAGWQARMEG
jgi:serine/threonine protein kinase/tetratricopeptide (TPR) repeat protein